MDKKTFDKNINYKIYNILVGPYDMNGFET